ncbi:SusC/RagA family TonB-linked outer membrane protein [Aquimarina aquimarini]|uniref:SusC/RagA family TonB-linked outer membrane protein n=1 Tax=Aquimarina aquimarini TaxID=1191734 RepID=UPI000D553435|nr:SusC/RagA family TonB-linked outer membrane protein [Aquimarina aquimarini]
MKTKILFIVIMSISSYSYAQQKITGSVIDDQGIPLFGVNVLLIGTQHGTTTDFDGNYELTIPDEIKEISFSYIGFKTKVFSVQNNLKVQMQSDSESLEEVVVTAAGIESNKKELGYSITNIKSSDIQKTGEVSISGSLSGKIAGVQVSSSQGDPGAATNIIIRGNTSISGTNTPLYIIDGVPISNDQFKFGNDRESIGGVAQANRAIDINPHDIESLTILKGPASTVLYGIRAANGAIIINTKKGKRNKDLKVNIKSSINVSTVTDVPERQNRYAKGTYAPAGTALPDAITTGDFTYGFANTFLTGPPFSWGAPFSSLEYDGGNNPYDRNGFIVALGEGNGTPVSPVDNLYDNFFQNGISLDNHISISGGTEKSTYYLSLAKLEQTGVQRNTDFSRTSMRINHSLHISEKLKLNSSLAYINSGSDNKALRGQNRSGIGIGLYFNATSFDPANGLNGGNAWRDPNTYTLPNGGRRAQEFDNPYFNIAKNKNSDNVNRIIGYVNPEFKIDKNLTVSYKLGGDHYTDQQLQFYDIGANAGGFLGSIRKIDINSTEINSDLLVTYNNQLSDKLIMNLIVGHNFYNKKATIQGAEGKPLGSAGLISLSNASTISQTWDLEQRKKLYGVFMDLKLNFGDYLFLNLSGRNDWSSTLPQNNNSLFYPAASIGFNIIEGFDIDSEKINAIKLRASYGIVGNDAPVYATSTYFDQGIVSGDLAVANQNFPLYGVNGIERNTILGNNTIKPESTRTYEFGTDMKLFNNRLNIDFTYYNSLTDDQIVNVSLPPGTGFKSQIQNAGQVSNKGFELAVYTSLIKTKSFGWDMDVTFSQNKSLVESLPEGLDNIVLSFPIQGQVFSSATVGQPFGSIFGSRFLKDDQGRTVIGDDGWPLRDTVNGDGIIGDPNPDWLAGIRNTLRYKNLNFTFLWDIRKGGDMYNGTRAILNAFGVGRDTEARDTQDYVFEGVNTSGETNTVPVDFMPQGQGFAANRWFRYGLIGIAEEQIQEVNWFRLREIALTYNLPSKWFNELIDEFSISVVGRNLLLFTNYDGIDPETLQASQTNALGIDYLNAPNTKSIGVNFNINF